MSWPLPNELAQACDEHLAVDAATTVPECHLVAVHLLCARLDEILATAPGSAPRPLNPRPRLRLGCGWGSSVTCWPTRP